MNLKQFSNIVKEIIKKNISNETYHLINEIPMGSSNYDFGFALRDKIVNINSKLRSIPTVFEVANRMLQYGDYTMTLKVSSGGKTKTVSKTFSSSVPIDEARKELEFSSDSERVFYEMITTDEFEITNSDYEGTVVKFKDENYARRFLQIFAGLFPFVETEPNSKKVEVLCEFEIEKYEQYKKEQKKRGTLKCTIKIDGEVLGTKSGTFLF